MVSVPGRKKEFELGTTEAVLGQCAAALRAVGHAPPRLRSDAIYSGERKGSCRQARVLWEPVAGRVSGFRI